MLEHINEKTKTNILRSWKGMSETDKTHFINQIAIAMSVWGSDKKGEKLVAEVLKMMMTNGTSTLADFGLYVDKLLQIKAGAGKKDKIERAAIILEGYRIKYGLSSIPHRDITK